MILRDYQKDAVEAIVESIDKKGNDIAVLPTGCHEKDYPIVMSDATIKKVQDVLVGDLVMGHDSVPKKVINLHKGRELGYRIQTVRGEYFNVNENHILHLKCTVADKYYPNNVDISVKDYLNWAKSRKHMYKLLKVGYETNSSSADSLPIPPYFLGFWLGDGDSNSPAITTYDEEVIEYLKNCASKLNLNFNKHSSSDCHYSLTGKKFKKNHLLDSLRDLNIHKNKHIPEIYFKADRESRLSLLAGLIDSDGTVEGNFMCELGFSNEILLDDSLRLIRSLGFSCYKRKKPVEGHKDYFRTFIAGFGQENIPTIIKRKKINPRKQKKNPLHYGFTVHPIGDMDYYGFELEGENGLYIDGQGFIQHNSGKSLIIANVADQIDRDILILQPSKEILEQNYEKMCLYVPESDIGVYSASMKRKDTGKYTLATIQSIYKKPELFQDVGLCLLDEGHQLDPKSYNSMYTKFLRDIGSPKLIGLTATPYRHCIGYHRHEGKLFSATTLKLINRMREHRREAVWNNIVYNLSISDLLEMGYLSPLEYIDNSIWKHSELYTNLSRSDFDLDAFEHKLNTRLKVLLSVIGEYSRKKRGILVFCSSVKQAKNLSEMVHGAEYVSGETKRKERKRIIDGFKSGKIKVLFNVLVGSVGFDYPELDCIINLRPTRSLPLFVQIIGRGLRIAEGKTHCTVIDFTGTLQELGKVEDVKLVKEKMWELYTGTSNDSWHNRLIYTQEIKTRERTDTSGPLRFKLK